MTLSAKPTLRAARPSEIGLIRRIERLSASRMRQTAHPDLADDEPTDAATLAARIAVEGLVVACLDDAPIAFVMFRPLGTGWYVEQIDVLPDHARRGIGAALFDEVARRARSAGAKALLLSTFTDVPFNAPYYARLGFEALPDGGLTEELRAIRAEHVARGLDEDRRVFMQRLL
jgi:predicted N-acetyltransferase YhbS